VCGKFEDEKNWEGKSCGEVEKKVGKTAGAFASFISDFAVTSARGDKCSFGFREENGPRGYWRCFKHYRGRGKELPLARGNKKRKGAQSEFLVTGCWRWQGT